MRAESPHELGGAAADARGGGGDRGARRDRRGGAAAALRLARASPGLIFTERRADLRRHAGEISFPGGRQDDGDADLDRDRAARGARRRSPSTRPRSSWPGRCRRPATFVTGYRIHPFVGLIPDPAELGLEPNPTEVETVLAFSLDALREGYEMRRLVRRGVAIHTPTYEVEGAA